MNEDLSLTPSLKRKNENESSQPRKRAKLEESSQESQEEAETRGDDELLQHLLKEKTYDYPHYGDLVPKDLLPKKQDAGATQPLYRTRGTSFLDWETSTRVDDPPTEPEDTPLEGPYGTPLYVEESPPSPTGVFKRNDNFSLSREDLPNSKNLTEEEYLDQLKALVSQAFQKRRGVSETSQNT